jgi:hypothetical protein
MDGRVRLALSCGALALAGCGDDDGDDALSAAAAKLRGIYEVEGYTRNEAGCDADGPSALEVLTEQHLFMDSTTVFGQVVVHAISCTDVEDCRSKATAFANQEIFGSELSFAFSAGGGDQITGLLRSTGFSGGPEDMCREPTRRELTLDVMAEGRIRIREESFVGDDYPEDSDGFCTTERGEQATAGKPCAELKVLTAAFLEAI